MPFDFPDAPTTGQVYSNSGVAWQYDGEKWKGGAPATQSDEQWFDVAGKTNIDVQVPSWARGVQIMGVVHFATANSSQWLYLSADGSTFFTGASDYNQQGPILNAGTTAYQAFGQANQSGFWLTTQGDNSFIPHNFTAELNLVRANTNSLFVMKTVGRGLDTSAGAGGRTVTSGGYLAAAPTTALAIKALRFAPGSGAYLSGWIKLKWLGDQNALPQSGAIVDAPSDGAEYVRVNGVWRKKCETFTWASSITLKQIVCPPGATRVRVVAFVSNPTTQTSGSFGWQGSQDGGATWVSVANSYYYSGIAAEGGTPATIGSVAVAATTWGYLGWLTNNTSVGNHVTADICLARPATGSTWTWHCYGGGYYDPAANAQRTWVINGYLSAGWGAGPINAIQFFNSNSSMAAGSIECTWGYG